MSRINLLPWRETLRKERRQRFFTSMGITAGAAAGVVVAIHLYVGSLIEAQDRRNNFLKSEIAQVEKKIMAIRELEKEKQKLLARMEIIQQLQTQRPEIVHIFDELPRRLPEGIYLTGVEQRSRNLLISGVAQSNARISAFMRQLDASPWFTSPHLEVIESVDDHGVRTSHFKLSVLKAGQAETVNDAQPDAG